MILEKRSEELRFRWVDAPIYARKRGPKATSKPRVLLYDKFKCDLLCTPPSPQEISNILPLPLVPDKGDIPSGC